MTEHVDAGRVDGDVTVEITRDGEPNVVELTDTEACAVGFWIATGRLHADVEPTSDGAIDAVEDVFFGVSEA